eukprot:CAMPEP_0195284004 /NCGR_PEP_ID=MMETSP0707-20130614/2365_1 /TAXON_ID=33640 /ORGANISM="Asterionellopsis glacialis, Strain CCMP134" /LENGTH=610 /DNA_ID=CAMNT_0040343287 /DNA_START=24 /DNA_END=1856 /DNA_ORIENTATION=-
MGRKKRKAPMEASVPVENVPVPKKEKLETVPTTAQPVPEKDIFPAVVPPEPTTAAAAAAAAGTGTGTGSGDKNEDPGSSGYAMTSHSGDLIEEDIYVSDGSDDEVELDKDGEKSEMEIVLTSSRLGVMRRGLHHTTLVQQNRQWVRGGADKNKDGDGAAAGASGDGENQEGGQSGVTTEELEERRRKQEEEELAKLDPVQRAARLLAEKQRKLEEAKEVARRMESEENAGRDPCLFSKRTAFDIRMDQIEDKPWARGVGDITDFFNYSMTEDDWVEYSQQQLLIRQELTDASRQRRLPDPTIVPVTPRAPSKQNPRVAVAVTDAIDGEEGEAAQEGGEDKVIGPAMVEKEELESAQKQSSETANVVNKTDASATEVVDAGIGGAWGAGAAPGSMLARLIEEQENAGGSNTAQPSQENHYQPQQQQPQQQQEQQQHSHQQYKQQPHSHQQYQQHQQDQQESHQQYQHQQQHQRHTQEGESSAYNQEGNYQESNEDGGNQQWDNRGRDYRSGGGNEYGGGSTGRERYDQGFSQQQQYTPRGGAGFPPHGGPPPPYGGRGGRGGHFRRPPFPPQGGRGMSAPQWGGRGRGRGGGHYRGKRQRDGYDGADYRRG